MTIATILYYHCFFVAVTITAPIDFVAPALYAAVASAALISSPLQARLHIFPAIRRVALRNFFKYECRQRIISAVWASLFHARRFFLEFADAESLAWRLFSDCIEEGGF